MKKDHSNYWRDRRANDPEFREQINRRMAQYYIANRDRIRGRVFERRFGITVAQKQAMIEDQGGGCWACESTIVLSLDHDHATGRIRGVLCRECNRCLGLLKESESRLHALAEYIRLQREIA